MVCHWRDTRSLRPLTLSSFYPTHRFFLTSDSVYVIVCNIAKIVMEFREHQNEHLLRIDYWLKQIRTLSNNSDKLAIFVVRMHRNSCIVHFFMSGTGRHARR